VLIGVLIFYGSIHFIETVNEPSAELHFSIKSFISTNIELRSRTDSNAKFKDEPFGVFLNSSQFFKHIILPVNHIRELNSVRIDFDDAKNSLFIEKLYLVTKLGGKRDTLKTWRGSQIDYMIRTHHHLSLGTKNESFIQLSCEVNDPYIEFDNSLASSYQLSTARNTLPAWLKYLSAFMITITCLMLFRKLISMNSMNIMHDFILNGNVLIYTFFGVLFLIFLNNQWHFAPDRENKENRTLASKPTLTASRFFEYPELYSSYSKDNYSFRNIFFFIHAVLKSKVFSVSPLPDDVIIGKKGWFFDNEINVINDFRKLQPYNPSKLFITSQILTQRKNWLTKRNIKFYILITPNKNRIYPEYMPPAYTVRESNGYNDLDLLSEHLKLHTPVRIIDPSEALKKAKLKRDVYYSTDTHWNLYGGFIGYQVLMNEIKKDFPHIQTMNEDDFNYDSYFNSEGDLAKMCELQDVFKRKEIVMQFKDPSYVLRNPESSSIQLHYENTKRVDSSNLKVLMFRDSYANYLIPFLNQHFKVANYIWSYEFLNQEIEEKKPDIVIFESLQRFMSYALTIPNSAEVVENK
jgi:hypothetical protein